MNRAQRRQAGRRGHHYTARSVAYDVEVRALDRHEWNADPQRDELAERPCDGDCYALVAEAYPANARVADHGVVVVAHVLTAEARPACVAMAELLPQLQAAMDEKIGPEHWHAGVVSIYNSVPEWQVDPDEDPCSRAEGLRRMEKANCG
jgi:hypothetical protein